MLLPHTESRLVELRPAGVKDAPQAYEVLFRLGVPGLPLIDRFIESFGDGNSACFLVCRKDTGQMVGVSTLSDLTPAGHVEAEINIAAECSADVCADANLLTVNFAFAMWRTRKVYFHLTTPDTSGLGLGGEVLRKEALLPDHTYFHGRLWDVHIFAVYRQDWDQHGMDILNRLV